MRKIYLILDIIFITAIVMLLNAYSQRLQTAQNISREKVVKKTSSKKKKILPKPKPEEHEKNLIAGLAESNLFEENRGQEPEPAAKPNAPAQKINLKLMGVCHFGELKGAIIVSNRRRDNVSEKSFFTIGEDVGEGYKLYDITEKTAIIKNNIKQIELELEKVESPPPGPVARPSARRRAVPRNSSRHPRR